LLFGLAFMMKQPGICFGLFAVVMVIWQAVQKRALWSRDFPRALFSLGAGMALPFAGFCLWIFAAGNFGRFWFWTFDYARSYATQRTLAAGWDSLSYQITNQFLPYGGFWLLAAAGLLAARRVRAKRKELSFALICLGCSCLGTTPALHFREHYFVLALPAFALVLGLGVACLQTPLAPWWKPWMPLALLALALAASVGGQRRFFFQLTPAQFCQSIYRKNPFAESQVIAQYVREHSPPEARIAVVGSEPELYFYARRHSATGYIYTYPLMEAQPYAGFMQREMIKEIESCQPEFIVLVTYAYSWLKQPASKLDILREMERYARQGYVPIGALGDRPEELAAFRSRAATALAELPPEAMVLYQRKPAGALAAQFQGDALSAEGKFNEAGEAYASALQLCPGDPAIQAAIAANDRRAQIQPRLAALLAELKTQPTAEGHAEAAALCEGQENFAAAVEHYSAARQLQPENPQWLNNLAWLLAACPRPEIRDGARAVTLARQACELTGFGKTIYLGTLAAAYAEAGKFDDAIATAQTACDRAAKDGDAGRLRQNQELLQRYRAHQTAHE
jgi:tetratricopeptide (TPR) repeat protein